MTTVTVLMEWEVGEDFRYRITAGEEGKAIDLAETRQYLHDQCRQHRQAVQAAIDAYYRHKMLEDSAGFSAGCAETYLEQAEEFERDGRSQVAQLQRNAAAEHQARANKAQAEADAIEVDEDWLPW